MKNNTFSLEGLLLTVLFIIGLYGAHRVLNNSQQSQGIAAPRQESPAIVMTGTERTNYTAIY